MDRADLLSWQGLLQTSSLVAAQDIQCHRCRHFWTRKSWTNIFYPLLVPFCKEAVRFLPCCCRHCCLLQEFIQCDGSGSPCQCHGVTTYSAKHGFDILLDLPKTASPCSASGVGSLHSVCQVLQSYSDCGLASKAVRGAGVSGLAAEVFCSRASGTGAAQHTAMDKDWFPRTGGFWSVAATMQNSTGELPALFDTLHWTQRTQVLRCTASRCRGGKVSRLVRSWHGRSTRDMAV